jgi:hypothetical protein
MGSAIARTTENLKLFYFPTRREVFVEMFLGPLLLLAVTSKKDGNYLLLRPGTSGVFIDKG